MPKPERYRAYLIVVLQRHERRVVCAVVKLTAQEALQVVAAAYPDSRVFLAGGLARNMARRLKLKHDEVRVI